LSDAPLNEAVTVAVVLALTAEALALNVPEVDPAATMTEEGTLTLLLLLLIGIDSPPLGAALPNVTVHVAVPGVFTEDGVHANELSEGAEPTVRLLPVAMAASDPPLELAATNPAMPALMVPAEIEGVIETLAITPSAIADVLRPAAMHT